MTAVPMRSNRLLYLLPLMTLAILAGFFGWSLVSGRDPASIGSALVGQPTPPLKAPALRPGEAALSDALLHTGKPVLVNFFASWCTPCLAEHPLFTRLSEREGATIIGIAWKNKREDALAWLKRLGDPFKSAGLDLLGKTGLDWGLSGVPETYAIDGNGIVRLHFRGPLTERDLNESIIPFLKGAK
jgi:cytochrome c biogenesis protein CcmG, thiol:disulfide interchange protein DsbE